jgi:hypothetical protein
MCNAYDSSMFHHFLERLQKNSVNLFINPVQPWKIFVEVKGDYVRNRDVLQHVEKAHKKIKSSNSLYFPHIITQNFGPYHPPSTSNAKLKSSKDRSLKNTVPR